MTVSLSAESSTIPCALDKSASKLQQAVAIAAIGRRSLSYAALRQQVVRTVVQLRDLGIERHDRVAMALPNGPEAATAFLSVSAGATCAPLNPSYRAREYEFYLKDLQAKALVVWAGVAEPARVVAQRLHIPIIELVPIPDEAAGTFRLVPQMGALGNMSQRLEAVSDGWGTERSLDFAQADDVALILHTSGTTSRPKMVPLSHGNVCRSAQNVASVLALRECDRCLNVMPLFHIHGLIGALLSSMTAGASVVCTPGFDAPKFLDWLQTCQPTWYSAVPTMHQQILRRAAEQPDAITQLAIRFIRSSSAPLPPQIMAELEQTFNAPVIEAYGMTEAAHQMASNPLPPQLRKPGSVGISAGPLVQIMNEQGELLPPGAVGEVVIKGENVTCGYERNDAANAIAFTHGWFRTGDLGSLDADGYLFLQGRLKEIINRGGEKISPREVDEVLLAHPAIDQVVTFAMPHKLLGETVGAAVVLVPGESVDEPMIVAFAAQRLADFKVPRTIVFLDEIPKGSTGKRQRIGLAEKLGLASPVSPVEKATYAASRTPIEASLVKIWAEALGLDSVGINDDFFQLGGDSIVSTQVVNRVRADFQVELTLSHFFERPTIVSMAAGIVQLQAQQTATRSQSEISRLDCTAALLPSFSQQRMLFLSQLAQDSLTYHRLTCFQVTGDLKVEALIRSLNEIVCRHEILRSSFREVSVAEAHGLLLDGLPGLFIAPQCLLSVPMIDLTSVAECERSGQIRSISQEIQQPFDLSQGPLVRARLVKLSAHEHRLLLNIHHIIFDGWSEKVLKREMAILYAAFVSGQPSPLPALTTQYADFAQWQRQQLTSVVLLPAINYWRSQLKGALPVLALPTDRSRTFAHSGQSATETLQLPKSITDRLQAMSQQENATLFMTLLAAFKVLLFRYTQQTDMIVGTLVSGRDRLEIEPLIGLFINTLAIRTSLAGNPTFRDLLAQVRKVALGAYAHQNLPFEKLVEALQLSRSLDQNPVFQVLFQLKALADAPTDSQGLKIEPLRLSPATIELDLVLDITEDEAGLLCHFEYRTDLFDATTIQRMAGHFQQLLSSIVADATQPITALSMLTKGEQQQILGSWNDTQVSYPDNRCIHQLFEAQVERTPEAIAVVCDEQQVTYRELNQRANQMARYLQSLGAKTEDIVGLHVEKTPEMIVALMGILKAGCAYLPLDPDYPAERLSYLAADAQLAILITQNKLGLETLRCPTVWLDQDEAILQSQDTANLAGSVTPQNLAYVMYTSGSTGLPKGVEVEHCSVVNFLAFRSAELVTAADLKAVALTSSISFDASVAQVFPPLLVGGKIVLVPEVTQLFSWIEKENISYLGVVPSLLDNLLKIDALPLCVKVVGVGGEPLSPALFSRLLQYDHVQKILNLYGPTEATVCACTNVLFDRDALPATNANDTVMETI